MGAQAVFIVLLVFVVAVETQNAQVKFWRSKIIMTCPGKGNWFEGQQMVKNDSDTYEVEFKGKAIYSCNYMKEQGNQTYKFYVNGKACENCYEVNGFLFMLVILVDVIGTAVVMRIIYVCCKRKEPDVTYDAPPRVRRSRPRQDQSSAYETLIPSTQATDTYSAVVHRTG